MDRPFFTTRRDFLAGGISLLSASGTLPIFLGRTARALAGPQPTTRRSADERILVVVQLAGGNDGLNTIVPYEMDAYYKARPQLAIKKADVLKLENNVGLPTYATALKTLFDNGQMAIVQGVGYPNPNRSHFTSMDIWQSADPMARDHSGWLGRYFDNCCKGDDPAPEPIAGVSLMKESPLAMAGEKFASLVFEDPGALAWQGAKSDKLAQETFRKLNNIDGDYPRTGGELAQWLQRASLDALIGADDIRGAGAKRQRANRRSRGGGGELGQSLDFVARMIASDLPTRVYYVSMGGFDTHSGQTGRHRTLISQFGDAMQDFVENLKEQGLLDRVLILCFSEFGRRVQENASGGTDHGEAAPLFLFGSQVRPGVHQDHPSLEKLNRGDLQFGCDFRRVYSAVLQDWLSTKPEKVLGKAFQPLALIKRA
ncbi:MAG: DUF1501 domain-containing protein [Phycisphaerales bacterium]|nr:DUF1501 domain-containing protein [Phycisphaerales bacterium]